MFYKIYVKGTVYYLVFTKNDQEIARIEYDTPVHRHLSHTTKLMITAVQELTGDDVQELYALATDKARLQREAFNMTREYLQGHSGYLPSHAEYGQMLFGADLDDWSLI